MDFKTLSIQCPPDIQEILIAELALLGCEAIEESDAGILASFQSGDWPISEIEGLLKKYKQSIHSYKIGDVEKQNWNERWEQNFDPVEVEDVCIIRAPFHQIEKSYKHEIIIMPKMSFGTGHHATTYQMVNLQLNIDHKGKDVVDLGTGTGVLAILAKKLGAVWVEATDIDSWCVENTNENVALNDIEPIDVRLGTVSQLHFDRKFDIAIANINKNVLLEEMGSYSDLMKPGATLLLSGFYEEDVPEIKLAADKQRIELHKSISLDSWAALQFNKPS